MFKVSVKNPYAPQYVYKTTATSSTTIRDFKVELSLKHMGTPDLETIILLHMNKKMDDEITFQKLGENNWTDDCVSFHMMFVGGVTYAKQIELSTFSPVNNDNNTHSALPKVHFARENGFRSCSDPLQRPPWTNETESPTPCREQLPQQQQQMSGQYYQQYYAQMYRQQQYNQQQFQNPMPQPNQAHFNQNPQNVYPNQADQYYLYLKTYYPEYYNQLMNHYHNHQQQNNYINTQKNQKQPIVQNNTTNNSRRRVTFDANNPNNEAAVENRVGNDGGNNNIAAAAVAGNVGDGGNVRGGFWRMRFLNFTLMIRLIVIVTFCVARMQTPGTEYEIWELVLFISFVFIVYCQQVGLVTYLLGLDTNEEPPPVRIRSDYVLSKFELCERFVLGFVQSIHPGWTPSRTIIVEVEANQGEENQLLRDG